MNCYLHPETQAVAFCRACGRSLCSFCQRTADGTIYCQDHVPVPAQAAPPEPNYSAADATANPYFQGASGGTTTVVPPERNAPVQTSPGLAFLLGFIPGVGAIYNGQYLKGLVHAVLLGMLIGLVSESDSAGQPLLAMTLVAFVFYMPFEAYHTAKKRQMGLAVEEWSSLLGQSPAARRAPVGPIILIGIGVLFLLNTMNVIRFRELGRFWPVLLIGLGAYLLWARVTGESRAPGEPPYAAPRDSAVDPFLGVRHE